jgi:hypothetical protein
VWTTTEPARRPYARSCKYGRGNLSLALIATFSVVQTIGK